jgi:hypothetical protein
MNESQLNTMPYAEYSEIAVKYIAAAHIMRHVGTISNRFEKICNKNIKRINKRIRQKAVNMSRLGTLKTGDFRI